MKKILLSIVLFIWVIGTMSSMSMAADNSNFTWHGYLVDANSAQLAKKSNNVLDFVQNYDPKTAADTQAAGYLLFAGKWYQLDKHGNELAAEIVKRSAKLKGFYVTVRGKLKGDIIVVEKLTETY